MHTSLARLAIVLCLVVPVVAAADPILRRNAEGKFGFESETTDDMVVPHRYDWAAPFRGGSATVELGGKFGVIDASGRVIVPVEYEYALPFEHGYSIVYRGGKYGAVDRSGKLVVPLEYERVELWGAHGLFNAVKDGKWGVVSAASRTVVPFEYFFTMTDEAGFTRAFQPSGPPTVFKPTGEVWEKPTAEELEPCGEVFLGKWKKKDLVLGSTLERALEGTFDDASCDARTGLIALRKGDNEGLHDPKAKKWIVPLEFAENVSVLDSGIIVASVSMDDGPHHFLNRAGERLFGGPYDDYQIHGDAIAVLRGKRWALVTVAGKFLTKFDSVSGEFRRDPRGYWSYARESGFGVIDDDGNTVVPFELYAADARMDVNPLTFSGTGKKEFLVVQRGAGTKVAAALLKKPAPPLGVIDERFRWALPLGKYEYIKEIIRLPSGRTLAAFKKDVDGKIGLYDLDAKKEILPPTYVELSASDDLRTAEARPSEKARAGVLDLETLEFVASKKFDVYSYFEKIGVALITDEGRKKKKEKEAELEDMFRAPRVGLGKPDGTILAPIEYDDLTIDWETRWFFAAKGGRTGFLDTTGKVVIPLQFEALYVKDEGRFLLSPTFQNGYALVKRQGQRMLIDTKGNPAVTASELAAPAARNLAHVPVGAAMAFVAFADEGEKEPISLRIGNRVYDRPGAGYSESTTLTHSEGLLAIRRNGKFGYIDVHGKEVIPCRYDAVTDFSGGKAYAKLGGSWQIINRAGAVLDHTDIGLLRLRKN